MQPLARDGLTDGQVEALLIGPDPTIGFGADLLDGEDRFVEDISADLDDASVERSMYANVHGTCDLTLYRDLEWGVDRVRLWSTVSDGDVTARFDHGVFLLTSPDEDASETPQARRVTGMDKLWLLQRQVGDTYVVNTGVSYLDAIRGVLTDAGVTGRLLLDGSRQATLLEEPAVWLLTAEPVSWLRVVNDLLAKIGYRGLWVDEVGQFRSQPYQPPSELGPEWTFDLTDPQTNIVGEDRSLSADVWDAPNWWRFVRRQSVQPTAGAGLYTVDRVGGELPRRKVVHLDAADQDGLKAQGDLIVTSDTQNTRLLTIQTGPLPVAGHFDIVQVVDDDLPVDRCQARRWRMDLAAGTCEWELEVL